jgi:exonuclease III
MSTPSKFKIVTWNATGIMSSASYLCGLLNDKKVDICGISEHWLKESNCNFINMLDSNYKSAIAIDKDCKFYSSRAQGKGGVALLWHVNIDRYVSVLPIDNDRILGIQLSLGPGAFVYIFQVYLPCSNHTVDKYVEFIEQLYDIWCKYNELGTVMFMGDFNAKVISPECIFNPKQRDRLFSQLLNDCNLTAVNILPLCTGAKSSFVSYDKTSESLIDHICMPIDKADSIDSCMILDDDCLNVSNHRPVLCSLLFHFSSVVDDPKDSYRIKWAKVTDNEKNDYMYCLNNSETLFKARFCPIKSPQDIDDMYDCITSTISDASSKFIKERKFKHFLKPYWNHFLSDLKRKLKELRHIWVTEGKPRDESASFIAYKAAKKEFRRHHRKQVNVFMYEQDR